MIKFSIVTVTYNAADVVGQTLQSIVGQTYPDYEIILIDGASTDATLQKVEPFRPFITQLVSEPDRGLYDAMNKGIERCTGDYLLFLNAGDCFYDSEVLQILATQLEGVSPLPTVIYGETALMNSDGTVLGMRKLKTPKQLDWRSFRWGMLVCHQSFWVRRDIAPRFNLTYKLSSDFDWCIRCLKAEGTVLNSGIIISKYLEGGLSKQRHSASLKERFTIMCRYYGTVPTLWKHLLFFVRNLQKKEWQSPD